MIIAKLIGGLGNQLFQYALARHLAQIKNTTFKLDIYAFGDSYKLHKYSLSNLNFNENFASREEINLFYKSRFSFNKFKYYKEKSFHFNEEVFKLKGNIYLDGYWQSEKYFSDISKIIKNDFHVSIPPKDKNLDILNKINDTQSVCLHIRRGDYIKDKKTNSVHGTCNLDYYFKAIKHIVNRIPDATFFVFSDDPQWCKENLNIENPLIFVDHNNADTNYEDLRLMSACKYFIIANSTFSWWGAWLSDFKDKLVIAPKIWFRKEGIDTKDIIPEKWIKI